jgi:hypothetical protein
MQTKLIDIRIIRYLAYQEVAVGRYYRRRAKSYPQFRICAYFDGIICGENTGYRHIRGLGACAGEKS